MYIRTYICNKQCPREEVFVVRVSGGSLCVAVQLVTRLCSAGVHSRGPCVCVSLQILSSPEGEHLRARQQAAVKQMYAALVDNGIPAVATPSHIIPIHVSGAPCYWGNEMCVWEGGEGAWSTCCIICTISLTACVRLCATGRKCCSLHQGLSSDGAQPWHLHPGHQLPHCQERRGDAATGRHPTPHR